MFDGFGATAISACVACPPAGSVASLARWAIVGGALLGGGCHGAVAS